MSASERDEKAYRPLRRSAVFAGIPPERYRALFDGLGAYRKSYAAGELIRRMGDALTFFPVILTGAVESSMPRDGHAQIVSRFGPGDSFAEAVPLSLGACPVDIRALEDTSLLQIPAARLMESSMPEAVSLRTNLMGEMSKKVNVLSHKLTLLAEPRLRTRILRYLESLPQNPDGSVTLPFTRKELAEYLGANDKALLRELRRLQDEGVLACERRRIKMLRE